jgi:hypothetical protein
MAESNWRKNYIGYLVTLTKLQAASSPSECLASCRAGLAALNDSLSLIGEGEVVVKAVEAMRSQLKAEFTTRTIAPTTEATPAPSSFILPSPRGHTMDTLTGADLEAQANQWAKYGCIERTAADSIKAIGKIVNPSSLIDNKVFVLLGATSALGPFTPLSKLGATIACIARPGAKLESLIEQAKKTPATLLLPVRGEVAGADLLQDAPEIADWISKLCPDKQLVIGCYAYLDGEKHVRASVAMDLIVDAVTKVRKDTALAYLVSPATPHAVSKPGC